MDETEPTEVAAREPAKKSKVGTAIAAILLASVAAGAGIFGGKLLHHDEGHKEAKSEAEPASSSGDAPPAESVAMPQMVVDVRDKDGDVHHLKVGLSFETNPGPEDEFPKIMPRGREAVLGYLRGLTFESATDPKSFDKIKADLDERVKQALGKERVRRVVVTDFVGQ